MPVPSEQLTKFVPSVCRFLTLACAVIVLYGCSGSQDQENVSHKVRSIQTTAVAQDLKGQELDVLASQGEKAHVLVFAKIDCPISNRFAPELARIMDQYRSQKVRFTFVFAAAEESASSIEEHMKSFSLDAPAVRDTKHELVRAIGATKTPEVAVYVPKSGLLYRGRIDDRFVDFGKLRAQPSTRDLNDVLEALVGGKSLEYHSTSAIGCDIEKLN